MKAPLSWLKTHLETEADAATIAAKLTDLGLEVESLADPAAGLAPFRIAEVREAKRHPNADKLQICIVDAGSGLVQVVCGAPNARTGMKGVFAPPGTRIPGTGLDLKAGIIRGIESNGMLCSARELGLGEDHDGIIDLPEDAPIGMSFAAYAKLDDPVFDIKVTPDRAYALGMFGLARDLAAAGLGRLRPFAAPRREGGFASPIAWKIDPASRSACPFVVGRYFRNVRNGPSPQWLQDRLKAIGLRPISLLVDITNFVTFDLGRPLHVFDADRLTGDLVMRKARAGESLAALDGKTYALDPEMTVIADDRGPQAIAGIMGGLASGCGAATVNVFLEVALFDAVDVARTGRRLGLQSDARYRFERGIDPLSAEWGGDVATAMILDLAGGEASAIVSAGTLPEWRREIAFRPRRVLALGGVAVTPATQAAILENLGCEINRPSPESWIVVPPSFRADIAGEADLVEEVLRIHGYAHIPAVSLTREAAIPAAAVNPAQKRVQQARRILAGRGLLEAVTFSFMAGAAAAPFAGARKPVKLANPISADLDVLRPSILGNLLGAAARNQARGLGESHLFEIGPVFLGDTPEAQGEVAALIRSGATPRHWQAKSRPRDAYDAKADALALLAAFGVPIENLQIDPNPPAHYHPGQGARLRLGPNILAEFGALHPTILAAFDLKNGAIGAEIFLDRLPNPRVRGTLRPLLAPSPLQPLIRDFAFLVDAGVPAEKFVKAARGADKAMVTNAEIFDVFAGGAIPAGEKSLALSVTIQPQAKTLTDAEIEAICTKIVAAIVKATGGELRGK